MTVAQLIKQLKYFDPNLEVMALDSSNGQGSPREINFGPILKTVTEQNAEDTADCENLYGEKVVVIGYGCY